MKFSLIIIIIIISTKINLSLFIFYFIFLKKSELNLSLRVRSWKREGNSASGKVGCNYRKVSVLISFFTLQKSVSSFTPKASLSVGVFNSSVKVCLPISISLHLVRINYCVHIVFN